jgi:hypothetical protein
MKRKTVLISFILLLCAAVLITVGISAAKETEKGAAKQPSREPNQANAPVQERSKEDSFSTKADEDQMGLPKESPLPALYKACAIVLDQYVNDSGEVNYSLLRRKRSDLFSAVRFLETIHPAQVMAMTDAEKQAFWINAYNLCTLKLIIDNYPIEPKWYMIIYPANSIIQISNPWTKNYFKIQGLEYCLQEIEQELLLERFKDPRICFAMSSATRGGASLRKEPYRAETLDAQLDDQVRKFIASPRGFSWNKDNTVLSISNVFNSYRDVFLKSKYAEIKKFRERKDDEKAWLNFLTTYLSEEQRKTLETTSFTIKFIVYDWNLNEFGAP